MPTLAQPLVVMGSENEPMTLAGPPTRLAGRVRIHNPGAESVVLRTAGLRDPSGVLQLPADRHALGPFVLHPDQVGDLQVSIAIDGTTPSGTYEAELDLAGHPVPVVLFVAEVFDPIVAPQTLVVIDLPEVPQRKRVQLTNAGNVPFTLGDPGPVDLYDDNNRDEGVRVAVDRLLPDGGRDLDEPVVALLVVARAERSLDVRMPGGAVELRPGDTATVEVEITVRGEPKRFRRYRGRIPVLTRDIKVFVIPRATADHHEASDT